MLAPLSINFQVFLATIVIVIHAEGKKETVLEKRVTMQRREKRVGAFL